MNIGRKEFLQQMASLGVGAVGMPFLSSLFTLPDDAPFFDISLAEWSLNRQLFDGELTHLEFPGTAKTEFGIDAVEYVNQFFKDKAEDISYLNELNKRCDDHGVRQLLIMIDGEGPLATTEESERTQAVENHYKWIEAAQRLGCHSIRVNLRGPGDREGKKRASVKSLGQLAEFGRGENINVIVENHGGLSSDAGWLVDVIQQVDMPNCGTLPDFGNFCIERGESGCANEYDRYEGVRRMMPYAKGVSAKSYAFNDAGQETTIDYMRMLKIIKNAGYEGHIGIEYEGREQPAFEGIRPTKNLLLTLGKEL